MRKSKIYSLCLVLIVCTVCQAQRLDIKPYILYHQSVSSQEPPAFYFMGFIVTTTPTAILLNENFTLATGLEYGFTIDYTFHNQLGIELGLGYFSSTQSNLFKDKELKLTADWDYRSIAIRPLFSYAVITGKSTFIGKIGPTIHYTLATINGSYGKQKLPSCTFANKLNWGYLIGLEYNYQLSERLTLAAELGFEHYRYTPNKATVEDNGKKVKEIIYVNKIIQESIVSQDPQSLLQEKRLKGTVLFNSIYFGIGVKYKLWKK